MTESKDTKPEQGDGGAAEVTSKMAVPVAEAPITFQTLSVLSKTPTVPARYSDRPKDMLAAVLYGREIGLHPMQAIHEIFLVDGKAALSGKAMSGLVHAAGHQLRTRTSIEGAEVTALRRDPITGELDEVGVVTFGPEDAERAKLAGKATYKQYPMQMYAWRALTMACRLFFADVLGGLGYTPEERDIPIEVEALPDEAVVVVDLEDESEVLDADEVARELDGDIEYDAKADDTI